MTLDQAKREIAHAFTRSDLRGPSFELTFAGATSFLRRRYTKDLAGVDIAVTGIPFDQAVTNRPGTRLGPRAIREASTLQARGAGEIAASGIVAQQGVNNFVQTGSVLIGIPEPASALLALAAVAPLACRQRR